MDRYSDGQCPYHGSGMIVEGIFDQITRGKVPNLNVNVTDR